MDSPKNHPIPQRIAFAGVIPHVLAVLALIGFSSGYPASAANSGSSRLDNLADSSRWVSFPSAPELDWSAHYDFVDTGCAIWVGNRAGLFSFGGYEWKHHKELPPGAAYVSRGISAPLTVAVAGKAFAGGECGDPSFRELRPSGDFSIGRIVELERGQYLAFNRQGHWLWKPSMAPTFLAKTSGLGHNQAFVHTKTALWWMDLGVLTRSESFSSARRFLGLTPGDARTGEFIVDFVDEDAKSGNGLLYVSSPRSMAGLWTWNTTTPPRRIESEGFTPSSTGAVDPLTGDRIVVYRGGTVRIEHNGMWHTLASAPQPIRQAQRLYFTAQGDLWAVSPQGLSFYSNSSRWRRVAEEFPNDRNNVNVLFPAADGSLWVGSQGGISIYGADVQVRPRVIQKAAGVELSVVTGIQQDRNGHYWVSSGAMIHGALRWDGTNWSAVRAAQGFTDQRIHRIRRDRQGHLWFISTGKSQGDRLDLGGAFEWDGKSFRRWSHETGLAEESVYDFAEDVAGNKWFFGSRSVSRFGRDGWRYWRPADPEDVWAIFSGAISPDGGSVYWVDRGLGLMHLDLASAKGEEIASLRPRHVSTPGMTALRDLRFDSEGALWMTGDQGLGVLRGEEFTPILPETGLLQGRLWPLEFWQGNLCVGHLGQGWSCLLQGQLVAHRIHSFQHQEGRAERGEHRLQVSWRVSSYRGEIPASKIPTRARINGGPWTEWTLESSASFGDLWPGIYRLDIQSKEPFGRIVDSPSVPVRYQGPFYLRPAYALTAAALLLASVAITSGLYRRQRAFARQLRTRDERFRALIEKSAEGLFLIDERGRFVYVSPSVETLLGRKEEEMLDRENWDIYRPEDVASVKANIAALVASPSKTIVLRRRLHHRTLGWRWFEITVSSLVHVPAVGALAVVFRDVTVREEQAEKLARAKEAAESASRAKSEFLATMSHEIRTPLNGVLGMAALLAETPLSGEQEEYVAALRTSGSTLLLLVNDILDLARVESGRLQLEVLPFRPRELMLELAGMWKPSAVLKGLQLDVQLAECPADQFVAGDAVRLRQVISNLMSNAIKFTEEGSVVATAKLTTPADLANSRLLEIEVRDTGIGIAPQNLGRIFDKFMQADSSTTRRFGGTGLGLAISRQLIELMGGGIQVESAPGKGARFHISVVLGVPDQAPAESPLVKLSEAAGTSAQPGAADSPRLAGMRILLAEDNPVNQRVIQTFLQKKGCAVTTASNGQQALDLYVDGQHAEPFDAILMDCQMPVLDGYDATRQIRMSEADATRVPIVALTANAMASDRERCLAAGMDEFLSKPVDFRDLATVLERLTQKQLQD